MTPDEARLLIDLANSLWRRRPISPDDAGAWYLVLDDVDAGDARRALTSIAKDGEDFPPGPGQVRRRVAEQAGGGRLAPALTDALAWTREWAMDNPRGLASMPGNHQLVKKTALAVGGWPAWREGDIEQLQRRFTFLYRDEKDAYDKAVVAGNLSYIAAAELEAPQPERVYYEAPRSLTAPARRDSGDGNEPRKLARLTDWTSDES